MYLAARRVLVLRFCCVHISKADLLNYRIAVDDVGMFLNAEFLVLGMFPVISVFEMLAFEPFFWFLVWIDEPGF